MHKFNFFVYFYKMDNLTIGLAVTVVILVIALYLYKRSEDAEDVQQRKELEGAHASIKQAQGDIEAIKKDKTLTVAEKERAIADAKKQLSDAQNLIQSKTSDLDALQKAKTAMELADAKSIADLKKSIEDRDKQIVTLKSDNARQTAEIDRRTDIHDRLVKSYNTKVNELNRVTNMASDRATDLQDTRSKLQTMSTNYDAAVSKLTQSTTEIEALRTNLAGMQAQCNVRDAQKMTTIMYMAGLDARVRNGSIKKNIINAKVFDYTKGNVVTTILDSTTNIALDGIILHKQVPSMKSDASQTAVQLTTAEPLIELGFATENREDNAMVIGEIFENKQGSDVLVHKFDQSAGKIIKLPGYDNLTSMPVADYNNPKKYFIRFNIYGSKPNYTLSLVVVNSRFK